MERIDSIIQNNREIVQKIKDYLDIVNYDFLVNHTEIKFNHYCTRRDCDDRDSLSVIFRTRRIKKNNAKAKIMVSTIESLS